MLPQLRNAGKAKGRPQHHCTPSWLVALERASIGGGRFDMDPASNGHSVVGAVLELTKDDDGLRYSWKHGPGPTELARARGRWRQHPGLVRTLHCNPPWEDMQTWLPRIAEAAAEGLVVRAVVPLRPHRVYWRWPEAICYVPPIAFEGEKHGFPGPVAVLAWGMIDEFVATFGARFPTNTFVLQPAALTHGHGGLALSADALHNRVTMATSKKRNKKKAAAAAAPAAAEPKKAELPAALRHLHALVQLVLLACGEERNNPFATRGYGDLSEPARGLLINTFVPMEAMRPDYQGKVRLDVRKLTDAIAVALAGLKPDTHGWLPRLPDTELGHQARTLADQLVTAVFDLGSADVAAFAPKTMGAVAAEVKAAQQAERAAEAKRRAEQSKRWKEQDKKRREAEAKRKKPAAKKAAKKSPTSTSPASKPAAKKASKKPAAKKAAKKPAAKAPSAAAGGEAAIDEQVRAILAKAKLDAPNGAGPNTEVRLEKIAERLGVSRPTALRSLKRLKDKRIAHMVRGGRTAAWVLTGEPGRPSAAGAGRTPARAALPPAPEAEADDDDDDDDDDEAFDNANGRDGDHVEA